MVRPGQVSALSAVQRLSQQRQLVPVGAKSLRAPPLRRQELFRSVQTVPLVISLVHGRAMERNAGGLFFYGDSTGGFS